MNETTNPAKAGMMMNENTPGPSLDDRIAERIDKDVTGALTISRRGGGIVYSSATEALEVAKMMAIGGIAVPQHCRGAPGVCLAIVVQSIEWGFSAYAVAKKSYVVNGNLSFESQLVQAVILKRAPIVGRFKVDFEGKGSDRVCKVSAVLADGTGSVEYVSPLFGAINPKNSPLWKNDPDQQLYYFSARALCRRHFPDVLLGIYTKDEFEDNPDVSESGVEVMPPPQSLQKKLDAIAAGPSRQAEDIQPEQGTAQTEAQPPPATAQAAAPKKGPGRPRKSAAPEAQSPPPAATAEKADGAAPAGSIPQPTQAAAPEADDDDGWPAPSGQATEKAEGQRTEPSSVEEATRTTTAPPPPTAAAAYPTPPTAVIGPSPTGLTAEQRTALLAYSERLLGSMSSSGLQRRTAEYFNGEVPDEATLFGRTVQQIFDLHTERTKNKDTGAATVCMNQVRALVLQS